MVLIICLFIHFIKVYFAKMPYYYKVYFMCGFSNGGMFRIKTDDGIWGIGVA